jgi:hypothetical protein
MAIKMKADYAKTITKAVAYLREKICRNWDIIGVAFLVILVIGANTFMSAVHGEGWIDGHHAGNMLYGALTILKSDQKLLSEVQSVYGIVLPAINAVSMYLFGETYLSLYVFPTLFYMIGFISFYLIFREAASKAMSFFSLMLMLVLHSYIYLPWSNYICFGLNALSILFFIKSAKTKNELKSHILLAVTGIFIAISALIRSQSILILPALCIINILYINFRKKFRSLLLIGGSALILIPFVIYLTVTNRLFDYYVQTIATQNDYYFHNSNVFMGVRQILQVFTQDYADGFPLLKHGLAVFNNLNGLFWGVLFFISFIYCVDVFVSNFLPNNTIIEKQSEKYQKNLNVREFTLFCIAVLTCIGPLFSLHNVYDNFRYSLHISQGIIIFNYFLTERIKFKFKVIKYPVIFILFIALMYPVIPAFFKRTADSLRFVVNGARSISAQTQNVKYFEGIILDNDTAEGLQEFIEFIDIYMSEYPDSFVYCYVWGAVTQSIYTVGKLPVYNKMLTNDFLSAVYNELKYYPNYRTVAQNMINDRRWIIISNAGFGVGLPFLPSDYIEIFTTDKFSTSVYVPRERALPKGRYQSN